MRKFAIVLTLALVSILLSSASQAEVVKDPSLSGSYYTKAFDLSWSTYTPGIEDGGNSASVYFSSIYPLSSVNAHLNQSWNDPTTMYLDLSFYGTEEGNVVKSATKSNGLNIGKFDTSLYLNQTYNTYQQYEYSEKDGQPVEPTGPFRATVHSYLNMRNIEVTAVNGGLYEYASEKGLLPSPINFNAHVHFTLRSIDGSSLASYDGISMETIAVPEPASLGLIGLAGLGLIRRRR